MIVSHSIWGSRPADLYGRRKRDRLYTALWGVGAVFGALASASRWTPSRVSPVQRTNPRWSRNVNYSRPTWSR